MTDDKMGRKNIHLLCITLEMSLSGAVIMKDTINLCLSEQDIVGLLCLYSITCYSCQFVLFVFILNPIIKAWFPQSKVMAD